MEFNLRRSSFFLVLLLLFSTCPLLLAQMNGEAARDWPVIFRDTLQHKILQFWIDHAPDTEYGGLLGRLNRHGEPIPPGDKSVVLISRALWSFSEAYRRYPDPAYQRMASACLKFLREKMWDKEHNDSLSTQHRSVEALYHYPPVALEIVCPTMGQGQKKAALETPLLAESLARHEVLRGQGASEARQITKQNISP